MQSGNLVPVFAVLGIAGLFFWLVPSAQGEWLNGFIRVLGGGFWVWVVVRAVARPLLHRRWERWEREMGERERWEAVPRFPPSYGRMADREPLKSHIMRWWEGSSPDARAYFFAFVLVVSTAVWQERTGGELVVSDFSAGEVELYTWRYWGITEKWTEVQFDQDSGVWLLKETGQRLICDFRECL